MLNLNSSKIVNYLRTSAAEGVARLGRRSAGALARGGAIAAVVAAAGCSGDGAASPPVFPVKGAVRFEGEPASGALVVFHPRTAGGSGDGGEGRLASGRVQPDGGFELTTASQADGATAGEYAVTVQWSKLIQQGGEAVAGPNVIPPVYASPETTPLKATVKNAPNRLEPFVIARSRK